MTSRCIVGPGRVKETSVVVQLTICIHAFKYVVWLLSTSVISFDLFVIFRVLFLVIMWWRFVPWPLVLRRNLGPRVCGHHAIVLLGARWCLSACGRNYIANSFCEIFGIIFLWFDLLRGVGPRRITVRTGCLGLSFWVLSTNWHGIMCILNSYMRASYSCISWRASLKTIVIMHHDVCIIESTSWQMHHVICTILFCAWNIPSWHYTGIALV